MTSVQPRAGRAGHTEALPVLALDADARLVAFGVEDHHVRDVDRALALDHTAERGFALRPRHLLRAGVALDHVQALDEDAAVLGVDAQDAAALAAVLARDHLDTVAGADLHRRALGHLGHQSTSGASETILMKLRSRSSLATGPKTRVPRGLFWSSMITA